MIGLPESKKSQVVGEAGREARVDTARTRERRIDANADRLVSARGKP
jgi:hypothetical protein